MDQLVLQTIAGTATHTLDDSGNATHTGAMTAATVVTTRGVASGTSLKVGGVASVSVAAATPITGATETETNFSTSYTLPANSLTAGSTVRIRAQGIHTATTGTETHTMLLKLGSTTLASVASLDPANADVWVWDFELVCRTVGAVGTVVGAGWFSSGPSGTGSAKGVALGSTVIDTTAALVIACAIDRQATATDSDSAQLEILTVRVEG